MWFIRWLEVAIKITVNIMHISIIFLTTLMIKKHNYWDGDENKYRKEFLTLYLYRWLKLKNINKHKKNKTMLTPLKTKLRTSTSRYTFICFFVCLCLTLQILTVILALNGWNQNTRRKLTLIRKKSVFYKDMNYWSLDCSKITKVIISKV